MIRKMNPDVYKSNDPEDMCKVAFSGAVTSGVGIHSHTVPNSIWAFSGAVTQVHVMAFIKLRIHSS